jgi:hypothetical protein
VERLLPHPECGPYLVDDFVGGRLIKVTYEPPPLVPGGAGTVYVLDDGDAIKIGHTKDKMVFKWLKGAQTDVSDFGLPTGTTAYALCLYAGPLNTQLGGAEVSADALLWSVTTTGFKYKDPAGIDDGIQKVILKAGAADQSKALAKGKGENLPDLDPGPVALPVTAQLVNSDGVCFEGVFDTTDVIRNEVGLFKGKAQ